jgi:hypothetical protein
VPLWPRPRAVSACWPHSTYARLVWAAKGLGDGPAEQGLACLGAVALGHSELTLIVPFHNYSKFI